MGDCQNIASDKKETNGTVKEKKENGEMKEVKEVVEEEVVEEEVEEVEEEEEEVEEEEEDDDDDDDDDDDGWITPGNIDQAKNSMNGVLETVQLEVACLTTDFAMQVVNGFIKKLF